MILASVSTSIIMVWSPLFALRIVRHWDISSGHARQIALEKRTYLVTTALKFVLVLELFSLILFVINADQMATMFTGAMCAVGTLNVNGYGMPALLLKLAVFFGASVWLILNHADEQGRDYPFAKHKYALLIGLAPLVLITSLIQFLYFYYLHADVITSCCSRLFVPEGKGLQANLSGMDPQSALYMLFIGFAALALLGHWLSRNQWGRALFGPAALGFFTIAIIAITSVISSYIYEQPHHHCPFDILKWQYDYIGFALYIPLFFGTSFGLAAGLMALFRTPDSLRDTYPRMITRNITISVILMTIFMAFTVLAIMRSHLILLG
jgi:hypothetical protein